MAQGERLSMSVVELDRLHIVQQIAAKELSVKAASEQLQLSVRQIKRLVRSWRQAGSAGMISRKRGGNRAFPASFKAEVMERVVASYKDFGPSFAAEKLAERDNLHVNRETLRHWMAEAGLWQSKHGRQAKIHQSRPRRSRIGELVQIDGSHHDWFEGRAAQCTLLVFIDDATSKLLHMRFEGTETTMGYFRCMNDYLQHYGRPAALYSDKAGIFTVNTPCKKPRDTMPTSQFGRAMQALQIECILAHSPQAKGRVERANSTLQDRLIKEMRLRNISNILEANSYLPEFILAHNAKFAVPAANDTDAHRPLTELQSVQLAYTLSHQETRKLSKNLECSYDNTLYQVERIGKISISNGKLRRAAVTICTHMDGAISLLRQGKILAYKTLAKQRKTTRSADSKTLNTVVDAILAEQTKQAA
jgi:hypothetical protein